MASKASENRARAEAGFKKTEKTPGREQQLKNEREAAARAIDANTARLRALRLARDAEEAEKAAAAEAEKPAKKPRRKS